MHELKDRSKGSCLHWGDNGWLEKAETVLQLETPVCNHHAKNWYKQKSPTNTESTRGILVNNRILCDLPVCWLVAGKAQWLQSGDIWQDRDPGTCVHITDEGGLDGGLPCMRSEPMRKPCMARAGRWVQCAAEDQPEGTPHPKGASYYKRGGCILQNCQNHERERTKELLWIEGDWRAMATKTYVPRLNVYQGEKRNKNKP